MRLLCLQHVSFEGPAAIASWAAARAHAIETLRCDCESLYPPVASHDGLIVLGGPQSAVGEALPPWLAAEKSFIAQSIAAGQPVLGICLGAQLIAAALGARVRRSVDTELGWWPIEPTAAAAASPFGIALPSTLSVFHWHGDTFDLPPDAIHLAASAACTHQAFAIGEQVLALQCHLEATPESIRALLEHNGEALRVKGPFVQARERILAGAETDCQYMQQVLFEWLDRLFGR